MPKPYLLTRRCVKFLIQFPDRIYVTGAIELCGRFSCQPFRHFVYYLCDFRATRDLRARVALLWRMLGLSPRFCALISMKFWLGPKARRTR